MTIIKYEQGNNYCLVQKNNYFLYFLLYKNNKFYYYEKILSKNKNKTNQIVKKFFNNKEIKTSEIKINVYEVLYKMCVFLLHQNEQHYCLISETFGDNNFISFQTYKDGFIVDKYYGVKNSASYLVAYFDYKIASLFPNNKDFLINFKDTRYNTKNSENILTIMTEKEISFYKRYFQYLFYLFKKMEFSDLYISFDLMTKMKNIKKFLIKTYEHYDAIIGKYFEKVILNISKKNEKIKNNFFYFFSYFKYYFPFLNFIFYLKDNKIKNQTVILHSCIFSIKYIESFLDNNNNYIINHNVIMREKMLLFIDEKIKKEEIQMILNSDEKNKTKKAMKTFKTFL